MKAVGKFNEKMFSILTYLLIVRNSMESQAPRTKFTSIYRHDISRWGGRTYRKPELESPTLSIEKASATNSTLKRCVQTMNTGCVPIQTEGTTYQSSYCSNIPASREEKHYFNFQKPTVKDPPAAPDPRARAAPERAGRCIRSRKTVHIPIQRGPPG